MRIYFLTLFAFILLYNSVASAISGGSASLEDGRLKIQFSVHKENSQGAYQLRPLLEQHGFPNEGGFVRTGSALAPLEIYNYLYDDGRYVFTIYLPVDDERFFASFNERGFVSFRGLAAQRLFDLVKLYLPKINIDVTNLEQYSWGNSYCDKTTTEPATYRCWINR